MRRAARDILLIAVLLAAALVMMALRGAGPFGARTEGAGRRVEITRDGEIIFSEDTGSLVLPYYFDAESDEGVNRFMIYVNDIGATAVRCLEADCPDKICVNTGEITSEGELIVCLPHRIIARIY